ncbi:hypothetical protein BGZ88_010363 [Linnemannia elongata]|nr:hypothetical protein BGZ88_010363 [Linnemannia elongata]
MDIRLQAIQPETTFSAATHTSRIVLMPPALVVNEMNNKINGYLATSSSTGSDLTVDLIGNCLKIMQRHETKDEIQASQKFRRLYITTPLGRFPSAAMCKRLAPPALQALTLVPIRNILFDPSGSNDGDTERIPTDANIECTDPDPLGAEDTDPIDNVAENPSLKLFGIILL